MFGSLVCSALVRRASSVSPFLSKILWRLVSEPSNEWGEVRLEEGGGGRVRRQEGVWLREGETWKVGGWGDLEGEGMGRGEGERGGELETWSCSNRTSDLFSVLQSMWTCAISYSYCGTVAIV